MSFKLSGNQNQGVVFHFSILGIGLKPKEISQMASKMTVHAEAGTIETVYGNCSKPKGRCGYASQDLGASTDSNEKLCTQNNEIVTQNCCKPKKGNWGKWSIPGMGCEA